MGVPMLNLGIENQGPYTFLVYKIGENDLLDTMSLGMLTNNSIPGFAPVSTVQVDNDRYVRYSISSKISAAKLFEGVVNKKKLISVLTGLVQAMMEAEEYMLGTDGILLDLDHIFVDQSTYETAVVCIPVISQNAAIQNLNAFVKNIIFTAQFDTTEDSGYVMEMLNYLNSHPVIVLEDFHAFLLSLVQEKAFDRQKPKAYVPPAAPFGGVSVPEQKVDTPAYTEQIPAISMDFGNFGDFGSAPMMDIPVADVQQSENLPKNEKKPSLFGLLQHKAQASGEQDKPKKEKASKKGQEKSVSAGFAIPGQEQPINPGFAIPGMEQPIAPSFVPPVSEQKPADSGFAIPGQDQPFVPDFMLPAKEQPVAPLPKTPAPQKSAESRFEGLNVEPEFDPFRDMHAVSPAAPAAPVAPQAYLIRRRNQEKIRIDKTMFQLGRDPKTADYCISDTKTVGRKHAYIVTRDGAYYIVDANSVNKTFVDGRVIPSEKEVQIESGATICLADEYFAFVVE